VASCVFPSLTFANFVLQLKDNIEKFFTWFVEEGKATVRLKEPAIDICLSKVRLPTRCNFSVYKLLLLLLFSLPDFQVHDEATLNLISLNETSQRTRPTRSSARPTQAVVLTAADGSP